MCSQPSIDRAEAGVVVAVVALEDVVALEQQFAVVGDPRLDAGQRAADRPEAVVLDRRVGGHRGGLRHPVALEHRHAAPVEELEDLLGDRCSAADGLAHATPEDAAHVLEELLLGRLEGLEQLGRDLLAADLEVADRDAELGRGLHLLLDLWRLRGQRERVDLLEDAGDAGQVGRADLLELGDDLRRVAAVVRDGRPDVEVHELDEQRVGVRQRQEEIGDVLVLDRIGRLEHGHDAPVVAVREHAALGRARWCPRCR